MRINLGRNSIRHYRKDGNPSVFPPRRRISAFAGMTLLIFVLLAYPGDARADYAVGGACTAGAVGPVGTNGNNLVCVSGLWQYPAYQIGATTATCNGTNAGMTQWNGSNMQLCNGSSWQTVPAASSCSPANIQTFASSGTWTKPTCGTVSFIECWGGGGGGGGGSNTNSGGGGGGAWNSITELTASLPSTVSVTIGAGGAAFSEGGTSSFGTLVYAYGGGGGATTGGGGGGGGQTGTGGNASGGTGGAGGTGPAGGVGGAGGNTNGGAGGSSTYGGGGGGAGGTGVGAGGASTYGAGGGGANNAYGDISSMGAWAGGVGIFQLRNAVWHRVAEPQEDIVRIMPVPPANASSSPNNAARFRRIRANGKIGE